MPTLKLKLTDHPSSSCSSTCIWRSSQEDLLAFHCNHDSFWPEKLLCQGGRKAESFRGFYLNPAPLLGAGVHAGVIPASGQSR